MGAGTLFMACSSCVDIVQRGFDGPSTWRAPFIRSRPLRAGNLASRIKLAERSGCLLWTNSIADPNVRTSNPVKSIDPYPADRMIAVMPLRIPGIVFEEPGPKSEGHGGRAHRHAGVSGIRVLDRIRR